MALSTVRDAVLADADAIAAVQVDSWRAAYRGLMPDAVLEEFTVLDARRARWREILAGASSGGRRSRTAVCERDGRVVGFASCGPSRDEPGWGEVWALYAHPAVWGTGAGRALLTEGLAYLAGEGFAGVMLWALVGNSRAIGFYEAAGFRDDGGRKDERGMMHVRMRRGAGPVGGV